jgi:hypothetical protein
VVQIVIRFAAYNLVCLPRLLKDAALTMCGSARFCWAPLPAAAKVNAQPTRSVPRSIGLRMPPMVFIQPKASSIRLRTRWLAA